MSETYVACVDQTPEQYYTDLTCIVAVVSSLGKNEVEVDSVDCSGARKGTKWSIACPVVERRHACHCSREDRIWLAEGN